MARIKSNIVNEITTELMARVNNFTYSSGEALQEQSIAEEFGISRTPVREAIMKLIDLNILERFGSKVIVKPITFSDIQELFEVREAVESITMKTIINRGGLTKETLAILENINNKLEESIQFNRYEENFYQDALFHEELVRATGNQRLSDIWQRITYENNRLYWMTMLTPHRYQYTLAEHKKILEMLQTDDVKEAQEAMSNHIAKSLMNYKEILEDGKWMNIMTELRNMNC